MAIISALGAGTPVLASDQIPIERSGTNKFVTGNNLADFTVAKMTFNVKAAAYGAVGNGSTDDTTAIQAAIAAAVTAGPGATVFFPHSTGAYMISSTLTVSSGITFEGESHLYHGQCEIKLTATNTGLFTVGQGIKDVVWRNLELRATSTTGTRGINCNGVYPNSSTGFHVDNCSFIGFARGIYIGDVSSSGWQCDNWLISHCRFNEGTYGIWFETKNATLTEIQGCFIQAATACVHVEQGGPFTMIDCAGSGSAGAGTFLEISTAFYDTITLIDCQAEALTYYLTVAASTTDLPPINLLGCTINAPIQLNASTRLISIGSWYTANVVATAGGTASLVTSIADTFVSPATLNVTSPNKVAFGLNPSASALTMQGMGINLGTATGAIAGQLSIQGIASNSNVIIANSGTGAATDAAYVAVNGRAGFGFDGAGSVVIDDRGATKNILFKTGGTTRMTISGAGVVSFGASAVWATGTVLPATTGAMTATLDGGYKLLTPSGNCTLNATGGVAGQRCTLVVTTSGTSSFNITFGTSFISTGVLATGTITAKKFTVEFIYDGTSWLETSRSTAM